MSMFRSEAADRKHLVNSSGTQQDFEYRGYVGIRTGPDDRKMKYYYWYPAGMVCYATAARMDGWRAVEAEGWYYTVL
eukprot:scaffold2593_cov170-Amphora_coffeaeformis.AAC.2